MKSLYIDTTSNEEIIIRLTIDSKVFEKKELVTKKRSQVLLPMIENILLEQDVKLSDLTQIEVNPGPGSFTGVRVGASVGNALSFALGIPVMNSKTKQAQKIIEPSY